MQIHPQSQATARDVAGGVVPLLTPILKGDASVCLQFLTSLLLLLFRWINLLLITILLLP